MLYNDKGRAVQEWKISETVIPMPKLMEKITRWVRLILEGKEGYR